jgi:two-component system phosphate regulon sensor histidine kinase PhoR
LFYTIVFFILAGLGDFVSGINARTEQELAQQEAISLASHQLRTPATAVKGFLSALSNSDNHFTAQQKHYIQKAYQENERELQLIDTMLLIAQADSKALQLHTVKTNLGALIDSAVSEQSANIANKDQKVLVDKPTTVWCDVDPRLMRLVVDNLLDNASKYTPLGGTIRIALAQNDKTIDFTVQDSGIGIAKKDIGKLFKRYSRVSSAATHNTGGSGLGLYLTKRIIDLHQGSITVTSEIGHGTIFNVQLRSQHG